MFKELKKKTKKNIYKKKVKRRNVKKGEINKKTKIALSFDRFERRHCFQYHSFVTNPSIVVPKVFSRFGV